MKKKTMFLVAILAAFSFSQLEAQFKMSGALQTWVYAWENPAKNQQNDFYQGFQFNMSNQSYKNLSLKTYFQLMYRGDPAEFGGRAYNFLINWKNNSRNFNMRFGRQFVYSGVINGTIDGLYLSYHPVSTVTVRAVAGIEAPYDHDFKLQKWSDNNAMGAYISVNASEKAKIDLSYFQRANDIETSWQQLGASMNGQLVNNLFYTGVYHYNMKKSEYQGMRFRLLYRFMPLSLSVEYNDQKPRIYEDSFFRIFKLYSYTQIRSQLSYDWSNLQFGLQYLNTSYESGESDNQIVLSLSSMWGNAGVLFQDGYGGKNLGFYGDIRYDITDMLQARAYASIFNYQRQTLEISEDAVSYSFGLNYKLQQNISLRADVQQASNSFYKNDWRGLLFFNYAFH